jgi:hypothetical protein
MTKAPVDISVLLAALAALVCLAYLAGVLGGALWVGPSDEQEARLACITAMGTWDPAGAGSCAWQDLDL